MRKKQLGDFEKKGAEWIQARTDLKNEKGTLEALRSKLAVYEDTKAGLTDEKAIAAWEQTFKNDNNMTSELARMKEKALNERLGLAEKAEGNLKNELDGLEDALRSTDKKTAEAYRKLHDCEVSHCAKPVLSYKRPEIPACYKDPKKETEALERELQEFQRTVAKNQSELKATQIRRERQWSISLLDERMTADKKWATNEIDSGLIYLIPRCDEAKPKSVSAPADKCDGVNCPHTAPLVCESSDPACHNDKVAIPGAGGGPGADPQCQGSGLAGNVECIPTLDRGGR
jgi:hypothetical protein